MTIGRFTIKRDDPENGQRVYGAAYLPEYPTYRANGWIIGVHAWAICICWERAS